MKINQKIGQAITDLVLWLSFLKRLSGHSYPDKTLLDFLQPLGSRLTTLAVTQKHPSQLLTPSADLRIES